MLRQKNDKKAGRALRLSNCTKDRGAHWSGGGPEGLRSYICTGGATIRDERERGQALTHKRSKHAKRSTRRTRRGNFRRQKRKRLPDCTRVWILGATALKSEHGRA
ncbi:unnamed protein product [Amoebophrya sp. A25]|nr:unnamed protein product [Amoebophrya sp. A25]|eukprot:GSA25T00024070001.1